MANRFFAFTKTVAVSGAQEPLTDIPLKVAVAIVQVKRTNAGYVTVGGSDADYATNLGINLGVPTADTTPASAVFKSTREANEVDLNSIYVDVETGGDGVAVFCSEC